MANRGSQGIVMVAASSISLWYTTRATGIVALLLLTTTVVLGITTAGRAGGRLWPGFALADLHKRISVMASVFVVLHVLTAVVDSYVHIGWASVVVPFTSGYQPLWTGLGTVAFDVLAAVAVSSALRHRLSARLWRAIHWSTYACWPIAMAHALGEGTDAFALWMDVLAGLGTVAVLVSLVWRMRDHQRSRAWAGARGAITRAPAPSRVGAGRP
jgi:methionine sulfoxide reductase heme-binding subunit